MRTGSATARTTGRRTWLFCAAWLSIWPRWSPPKRRSRVSSSAPDGITPTWSPSSPKPQKGKCDSPATSRNGFACPHAALPEGLTLLAQQLRDLIAGCPLGRLDDASRDIWKALSGGLLSDAEAQSLAEAIHARRIAARSGPHGPSGGPGEASKVQRSWSYFPSKKRPQRSP